MLTCNYKEGGVLVGKVQGDQQAWLHELDGELHLLPLPPYFHHRLLPGKFL